MLKEVDGGMLEKVLGLVYERVLVKVHGRVLAGMTGRCMGDAWEEHVMYLRECLGGARECVDEGVWD